MVVSVMLLPTIKTEDAYIPVESQSVETIATETITVEKPVEQQPKVIQETKKEPERKFIGTYTVYAYCPCEKCCGKRTGITASGTKATQGRTIASTLPFGTKVYIEGIGERISEDTGSAIKGKKIDLFMNSHEAALKFGVKKLDVYIIK